MAGEQHEPGEARSPKCGETRKNKGGTYVYLAASQPKNTVAARYVRLLTIGRFELALTWVPAHVRPTRKPVDP